MTAIPFVTTMADGEAGRWRAELQAALPEAHVCAPASLSAAQAERVEVAIVANPDPSDLERFPSLRWVQSLWAGVERLVAALPPGIGIARLVDPMLTSAMAEGVLAHVLFLHRRMPEYLAQQRTALWRPLDQKPASERTVAVLGLGELGRASAARLVASGFRVVGWSRSQRNVEGVETRCGEGSLGAVLGEAEIVVVLLPLTGATRGLLDEARLSACRHGTMLVNVGRGPIVESPALLRALDEGRIAHAILDVFDAEPLAPDHPFWPHPSVTVMPHVAAPTNRKTASVIAAANIRSDLERGEAPRFVDRNCGY